MAFAKGKSVSKSSFDVYIVLMSDLPLAAYDGSSPEYEATKPKRGNKLDVKSEKSRKYAAHLKNKHNKVMQQSGLSEDDMVHHYTNVLNGFSARMNHKQAQEMLKI